MDGEILLLVFPQSRIPVRFDQKVFHRCVVQCLCIYCGSLQGVRGGREQRQGIDRSAGLQRKFKGWGEAINKKINHKMRSCKICRKRHGVWQCMARDLGPRLRKARVEVSLLFVLEAGLTMGKRTDLTAGLLRPRLSQHSPAWPVVRNKPNHDFQHTNYTDSCFSNFSSPPSTTPKQHSSTWSLGDPGS